MADANAGNTTRRPAISSDDVAKTHQADTDLQCLPQVNGATAGQAAQFAQLKNGHAAAAHQLLTAQARVSCLSFEGVTVRVRTGKDVAMVQT